jgi:hypothetical protein
MLALTDEQRILLLGNALGVSAGCELLNLNLDVIEDISADLVGGSIARNMNASPHGSCTLQIGRELRWGSQLVRPYMDLSNAGVTSRFYVGVFSLLTPEKVLRDPTPDRVVSHPAYEVAITDEDDVAITDEDSVTLITEDSTDRWDEIIPGIAPPPLFDAKGLDRLYLLDRYVAAAYSITAGTTYYDALVQVFADAGLSGYFIDGDAASKTLPVDKDWPLVAKSTNPDQTTTPVTWLRIVNDLMEALNFRGVFADETGLFRCQQYIEPAARASEFTFDATDPRVSIVGVDRVEEKDIWKLHNRWVFRWKNRPGGMSDTEGDGIYSVDLEDEDPLSLLNRGIDWPDVIDYDAASQATLEGLGARHVASEKRITTRYKITTGPFPAFGHADIVTYVDDAIGGSVKCQVLAWEFGLTGEDATVTLEAIS